MGNGEVFLKAVAGGRELGVGGYLKIKGVKPCSLVEWRGRKKSRETLGLT